MNVNQFAGYDTTEYPPYDYISGALKVFEHEFDGKLSIRTGNNKIVLTKSEIDLIVMLSERWKIK